MTIRKILFIIPLLCYIFHAGAVEYAEYQEMRYEENGFSLVEATEDELIIRWDAPEDPSYEDLYRVMLAVPDKNFDLDYIEYVVDIHRRQEHIDTITAEDDGRYARGFRHHISDFVEVEQQGWFRSVYPIGINIQPYRNVNYREPEAEPIQFQGIIQSLTLRVDISEADIPTSNYEEADSFRRMYQLLFLNNDQLDDILQDPRYNPAFDFEDVSWSPSMYPEHQFFQTTVYRTGINRIMGYELYRAWGEEFHNLDPSNFYLVHNGEEIPIHVHTAEDDTFRFEDYILFYGEKAEQDNIYTTRGEYFLGYGEGEHARWDNIPPQDNNDTTDQPADAIFTSRSYQARHEWDPSLNIEDGWYWEEVPRGSTRHLEFEVPDFVRRLPVEKQDEADIQFKIYLAYPQETRPVSILEDRIYINDEQVELEEDDIHDGYIEFSVPFRGKVNPRQTNRLVFESTGNVPKNIYIDRFYVHYPLEILDEQNYVEFQTIWEQNYFSFQKPNTNFFLFNKKQQALYQMEGENDFLYDFSYTTPDFLEEYGINNVKILATADSHRFDDPWAFLNINEAEWEEDRKGVFFLTFNPAENRIIQTLHMGPDMSDERIIHLDGRIHQAIRNLQEEHIMFVVTSGDYQGESLFRGILRSRLEQLGVEKPAEDFLGTPFTVIHSPGGDNADVKLYTYDRPHEFKDSLFLTLSDDIERSDETYEFTANFPSNETLIYGDTSGFKKPSLTKVRPGNLREEGRQIDYVIITHPHFYETLQPFIEFLEENKQLSVEVANIYQIYQEFSYGSLDPRSINRYLRHLFRHCKDPLPSYALLVGDANIDYRNFYNTHIQNFVPSYRPPEEPKADANENFYSRLSEGILNDINLGRWPVHAQDQLRHIIDKTIAYQQRTFEYDDLEWLNRLTFLIDNGYEEEAEFALGRGVPRDYFMEPIYLRHYPFKDNRMYPLSERNIRDRRKRSRECTAEALENLNRGTSFFFYLGHGGPNLFSHQRIILGGGTPRSDVRLLENKDRYFFMVVMSCLNGFFDYHSPPWHHSISADFLTRPNAGSVAVFAPTGKGVVYWQQELSRSLFNTLFSPYNLGLGESVTAGRTFFQLSQGNQVTDDMYVYLGEPSLDTIYPKLNTSIEIDTPRPGRPVTVSGTIRRPDRETYNRRLEYLPAEDFSGKGKIIFYNEDSHEIYRRENIQVNDGKWETSVLLPDANLQKLIARALFVNKNGEVVALGEDLANGYMEMEVETEPSRWRKLIDLFSFWSHMEDDQEKEEEEEEKESKADFQIRDIRTSHRGLPAGNSSFVKVRVKNNSPQSFSRVLVRSYYSLEEDGEHISDPEDINWQNMRSQSSWPHHKSLSFEPFEEKKLVFKLDPETIYGPCYFKVTVNEHKVIDEICYDNNVAYASLRYLMRPDLAVENVTLNEMDRDASRIKLDVEIANHGQMTAHQFFVSYSRNGRDFTSRSFISELGPGESKTLTVEGTATSREGTIKIIADPGTGESNYYNGVVFEHLEPVNRFQTNNVKVVNYSYERRSISASRLE